MLQWIQSTRRVSNIARLHPASIGEIAGRLPLLLAAGHYIAVAARNEAGLLGWISARSQLRLEARPEAEITALVVDARMRRAGIGAALVDAAEAWAWEAGLDVVVVRSNAARAQSHPFYAGHGYSRAKTQHVYVKQLAT